jgi:hypothetical protein
MEDSALFIAWFYLVTLIYVCDEWRNNDHKFAPNSYISEGRYIFITKAIK